MCQNFHQNLKKTCTCKHNSFNYDNYYKHGETELITGMEIAIDLAIFDQYHNIVPSAIKITHDDNIEIRESKHNVYTKGKCTKLIYRLFSNSENANFTLHPQIILAEQ